MCASVVIVQSWMLLYELLSVNVISLVGAHPATVVESRISFVLPLSIPSSP